MADDSLAIQRPRPPRERRWYWLILRCPLTRIILFGPLILIAAYLPFDVVLGLLGATRGAATGPQMLLAVAAALPGAILFYCLLVHFIEWRRLEELSWGGAAQELGLGILAGGGLFAAVIGVIALAGGYHITDTNGPAVLLTPLAIGIVSGVVEEIVFRGVVFRIIEESLGTWISVLISAALFGFIHASNKNATLISSLSIAISAGPLLAGAFVLTRRLWLCIGLHFAWNFTQGGIFGAAVSGNEMQGILQSELTGPELISGGAFGPEASIFTVILAVALSIAFFALAARRGRLIRPFWRRTGEDSRRA
jgi:hypothetical protein